MVTKVMHCYTCGKEMVLEFDTELHAMRCTRKLCDKCKKECKKLSNERNRAKRNKHYVIDDLHNDQINKACDRFFRKRGLSPDRFVIVLTPEDDVTQAVQYGESAAKRYMGGAKNG